MDIVARRKIFYFVSGALSFMSVGAVLVFGLKFGIDFTGGSLLEAEFAAARPSVEELTRRVESLHLGEVRIQPAGEREVFVRLRHINEEEHQALLRALGGGAESVAPALIERRFDTVGPTIGKELRQRSITAIALVIVLIVSYVAWAFRKVSAPVASWKYGVTTVVALAHDVIIPTGFFAVVGRIMGFDVDTLFVTALLTILGFSVHDTIVVFDRIREHLKQGGTARFEAVVNQSVRETFTRSVNTSLTVVLALSAVYVFGGATTKAFSVTLIAGIIVGTYSSICIASPLLVTWNQFRKKTV